ncbi:TPA: tetratricopeptide repeat protein [Thermoplasmata archaeon]|nr:tetratricopeptide repeat protein [Thermoplasmata archaeon]
MEELAKLHLGCGAVYRPGFINLDMSCAGVADVVGDVMRLPFKDATAERIEAFQVIEHCDLVHCRYLLAEWFRVIADGGDLVIETPDLEESLKRLVKSRPDNQWRTIHWIFGIDSPGLGHKTGFTRDFLAEALKEAGFTEVRWRRQETHRYEHGMRVECRRAHAGTRACLNSVFRAKMIDSCRELDSFVLVPMEEAIGRALKLISRDGAMEIDEIKRATALLVIRNPCVASAFIAAAQDLRLGDTTELSRLKTTVEQLARERVHHRAFGAWMVSRKEFPLDVQFDRFMESIENDLVRALMEGADVLGALTYLMKKEPAEIGALTFELVKCQANMHLGIGSRYLETGRLESAKEHLNLACSIDPSSPHAHWNLGRVLAASERSKGPAVKELETALSLTTHKGERAAIEKDLGKIMGG